ncbi:MAG: hypothetical protein AB8G05_16235 [Oligoflexales bacterium]
MKISKILIGILLFASLYISEKSVFAKKKWGLGLTLFDINGLSVKKKLKHRKNIDLNLGWYTHKDELKLIISAHYNWVSRAYFKLDQFRLDAYLGLGVKIPSHGKNIEVRTPFGVSHYLGRRRKFEAFCSIIPGMTVYPSTALRLSLALGGRFYF